MDIKVDEKCYENQIISKRSKSKLAYKQILTL